MKNRVALITGSTSGIGLGIAHVLAEAGFHITLHGLLPMPEGEALAAELRDKYGCKSSFSNADLRAGDAIAALVGDAQDALGSVDVLVNNAGIQFTAPAQEFPPQQWDAVIGVNLSAAFHTIHHTLPAMQAAGWGRIINIASVHGLVASVNKAAYVAAKHGIVGLTKVVALENVERGITCNAICPGWVDTPLIARQIQQQADAGNLDYDEARLALITGKQPMPEMTQPSSIGQLVLFLCSDAARTMTGTALPIDGAWTAQ
ncbi:3-hydroxybutyrate dehydrogenase [Exilibacterium tricleocarpae]|uniref:3-hydroxybutyrate dehydrogenase n=1 Tax=Exilibacterium tricleocarpae TaxID=2591008 RepID=UPI0024830E82|nr:3-hydroxybutyrate dehydrogenase [Exilibacterium tricleocarpae]